MASSTSLPQNRRTTRQVAGTNQNHRMERHALQQEIWHLRDLLSTERANCCREHNWKIQLSHELDETKQQLANQKWLKEVRNDIKRKKKKDLQQDYEELQVAFTVCQERLNSELQEKDKIKVLQEDLKLSCDSLQLRSKWSRRKTMFSRKNWRNSELHTKKSVRGMRLMSSQQADSLHSELQRQIKSVKDRTSCWCKT
ncbi:uncharacterized protein AKAME5_001329400 [Lates japonicus]|uniref:Uncharacterized protein n=1 Tax=Lates japonicus TaxID=270547 RepID=A0AAD3RAA3_LATJO|nr:uncharacterized protein AKAME5_001329400 [Lates japonicus]